MIESTRKNNSNSIRNCGLIFRKYDDNKTSKIGKYKLPFILPSLEVLCLQHFASWKKNVGSATLVHKGSFSTVNTYIRWDTHCTDGAEKRGVEAVWGWNSLVECRGRTKCGASIARGEQKGYGRKNSKRGPNSHPMGGYLIIGRMFKDCKKDFNIDNGEAPSRHGKVCLL